MTSGHQRAAASRADAVIFDVDGTLCDVRSIRHFVEAPAGRAKFKPDFDRFHAASSDCMPNASVKKLAIDVKAAGMAVIVVTGREAKWRHLTAKWLEKHHVPFDGLFTRGSRDYRPDHVIKGEIEKSLSTRYLALLAVDDRPDIIEVWQAAEIPTALVRSDGFISPAQAPHATEIDLRIADLLQNRGHIDNKH